MVAVFTLSETPSTTISAALKPHRISFIGNVLLPYSSRAVNPPLAWTFSTSSTTDSKHESNQWLKSSVCFVMFWASYSNAFCKRRYVVSSTSTQTDAVSPTDGGLGLVVSIKMMTIDTQLQPAFKVFLISWHIFLISLSVPGGAAPGTLSLA